MASQRRTRKTALSLRLTFPSFSSVRLDFWCLVQHLLVVVNPWLLGGDKHSIPEEKRALLTGLFSSRFPPLSRIDVSLPLIPQFAVSRRLTLRRRNLRPQVEWVLEVDHRRRHNHHGSLPQPAAAVLREMLWERKFGTTHERGKITLLYEQYSIHRAYAIGIQGPVYTDSASVLWVP